MCTWIFGVGIPVPLRCGRVLQQPPVGGGVSDDSKNESTFVMFAGMPTQQLLPHVSSFSSCKSNGPDQLSKTAIQCILHHLVDHIGLCLLCKYKKCSAASNGTPQDSMRLPHTSSRLLVSTPDEGNPRWLQGMLSGTKTNLNGNPQQQ